MATAFGPQLADRCGESGETVEPMPWCLRTKRLDMELDVRRRAIGPGAGECADLAGAHGHWATAAEDEVHADFHAPGEAVDLIVQRWFGNLVYRARL